MAKPNKTNTTTQSTQSNRRRMVRLVMDQTGQDDNMAEYALNQTGWKVSL